MGLSQHMHACVVAHAQPSGCLQKTPQQQVAVKADSVIVDGNDDRQFNTAENRSNVAFDTVFALRAPCHTWALVSKCQILS